MAVIDGNEIYPYYQGITQDLYNLSDELSEYLVDYWPTSVSDNPNTAIEATAAVGMNLPLETVTYSILSGDIVNNYTDDFYYRVHVIPNPVNLGLVLSEQNISVEVWNAFFISNPIASIVATNAAGITFTNGSGLTAFTPLEYRIFTLNVIPTGTAIIDASFQMNFSFGAVTLIVTGQRTIIWPFPPLTEHTEEIAWKTDIIRTIAGEQGLSLRDIPKITFNYSYYFRTVEEFSLAKNLARTYTNLYLATPVWSQLRRLTLTSIPGGSSNINMNTSNLELAVGDIAVIYQNYKSYETVEILTITANNVSFKTNTINSFTGTIYFIPMKICIMPKNIDFSRAEAGKNSVKVAFQSTNGFVLANTSSMEQYNSLPVISTNSVVEAALSEKYERNIQFIDNDIGDINPIDLENYTRHRQNIAINAHGQANIYTMKRILDYMKGMYNYFYLPSFSSDCIPVTVNLTSGDNSVVVIANNLNLTIPKFIRIIGDTIVNVAVASVSISGGNETIVFTTTLGVNVNNLKAIQILTKVRLDTDTITINYDNSKLDYITAKVTAPVLEVL